MDSGAGAAVPVDDRAVTKRIYSRGTPLERAMEHVILDARGCWLWSGATTTAGYANLNLGGGKYGPAHRVTFEHFRAEVKSGLELDHLCRVRSCVNPWHLEAVTHRENLFRGEGTTMTAHKLQICKRGHSLADAHRDSRGRVRNCRTCRREKVASGEWKS